MEQGKKEALSVLAMMLNLNQVPNTNLSNDMISSILFLLPAKTVVRFKCVSKNWCSLIESADFIKFELNHSHATRKNYNVILHKWYLYMVEFESLRTAIKLVTPSKEVIGDITEVFGSCNGLVAVCNSERKMALWNPSTRKSQRLPFEPVKHPGRVVPYFAFLGFGCDLSSEDYKVVRMVQFVAQDDKDGFFYAEVYSLKNNSLKKINELPFCVRFLYQPNYLRFYRRGYGVYACGAVHWVASEGSGQYMIVAFDLEVEKFQNVPLPDMVDNDFEMDVGVLEEKLCMILNYKHHNFDIWVMEDYRVKKSWKKKFSVPADSTWERPVGHIMPLAYSESGEEVLLALEKKELFWYNTETKRANEVRIEGAPESFGAHFYVKSLVPVGRDGMDQRDDFLSKGFKLTL